VDEIRDVVAFAGIVPLPSTEMVNVVTLMIGVVVVNGVGTFTVTNCSFW